MKREYLIPKAIFINFLIAFPALVLNWLLIWLWGGPKMNISEEVANFVAGVFLALFLITLIWRFISKRKAKTEFARDGIYRHIRYPLFSGAIFFLNPAIAFYFRSWFLIVVLTFIYWAWARTVRSDEVFAVKEFGDEYRQYRLKTPKFIPKLANQRLFFSAVALLIFVVVFISLNFFTFYFRYVNWEEKNSANSNWLSLPGSRQNATATVLPKAKYNEPDSIVINKIGITAPLIKTAAKNEKELAPDLDRGVVIYPGSAAPGQNGNFFLTGHSSTYFWKRDKTPYGEVFAGLDKLQAGDRVIIYYGQYKYEYEIFNKYIAIPNNVRLYHPTDSSIISLMTCWPIGTTWKRIVVEGKLVEQ